jgi:hypothetical protein
MSKYGTRQGRGGGLSLMAIPTPLTLSLASLTGTLWNGGKDRSHFWWLGMFAQEVSPIPVIACFLALALTCLQRQIHCFQVMGLPFRYL